MRTIFALAALCAYGQLAECATIGMSGGGTSGGFPSNLSAECRLYASSDDGSIEFFISSPYSLCWIPLHAKSISAGYAPHSELVGSLGGARIGTIESDYFFFELGHGSGYLILYDDDRNEIASAHNLRAWVRTEAYYYKELGGEWGGIDQGYNIYILPTPEPATWIVGAALILLYLTRMRSQRPGKTRLPDPFS